MVDQGLHIQDSINVVVTPIKDTHVHSFIIINTSATNPIVYHRRIGSRVVRKVVEPRTSRKKFLEYYPVYREVVNG